MPHHHRTSISRVQVKSKAEWLQLLEGELAKNPRSTVYSLATVFEGAPRVRSVVHRAFTPSGLLLTTTDLRMPKTTQLAADSRVEVAWVLPTLVQFRITGRAYIVPASGPSSVSRVSSLKVSRSFRSPRNPSSLRRTPSSVSNASSASASGQPTPPLESVDSNLELTATPASMSKEGSPAPPSLDSLKLTSGSGDSLQPPSTEGSGSDTSGAPSRTASGGGRPRLQLTPTPADLASSDRGERATSPLIARSPRGSPPLSAGSSPAPQFLPRAAAALNPAVTVGEGNSDITIPTLAGTLSALSSWGVAGTAPESSPSWWDAERGRIWDGLSPALRASFARPAPPGSTLADAPSSDTWITKMESYAKTPEEAKTLTDAWEHFAVLALAPERVEMLELDCEPHRRCCWHRDGDQWVKEELVP